MKSDMWYNHNLVQAMLQFARGARPSDRRFRLVATGVTRQCWHDLTPNQQATVEVMEAYADYPNDEMRRKVLDRHPGDLDTTVAVWSCTNPDAFAAAELACMYQTRHRGLDRINYQDVTQASIIRDVFGNPFVIPLILGVSCVECQGRGFSGLDRCLDCGGAGFRNAYLVERCSWLTVQAVRLAQLIYRKQEWDRLPVLLDALAKSGCDNEYILNHLTPHPGHLCSACNGSGYVHQWNGMGRCHLCRGAGVVGVAPYGRELCVDCMVGFTRSVLDPTTVPFECGRCFDSGWRARQVPHVRGCHVLDALLGQT